MMILNRTRRKKLYFTAFGADVEIERFFVIKHFEQVAENAVICTLVKAINSARNHLNIGATQAVNFSFTLRIIFKFNHFVFGNTEITIPADIKVVFNFFATVGAVFHYCG